MINIQETSNNIITLSIDDRERNTNTINEKFIVHFETLVEEITRDETIKGVVLTSAKSDFIRNLDLNHLHEIEGAQSKYSYLSRLQRSMTMLEDWGKPVVAALSGSALGAGLELALCCHHRLAIAHPTIRFGFSPISQGLIPGLGGIQRLSRLVGLEEAHQILVQDNHFSPHQAWEVGLINGLAETKNQMLEMAYAWIEQHPESTQPWVGKEAIDPFHPNNVKGKHFFESRLNHQLEKEFQITDSLKMIYERLYDGLLVDFKTACLDDSKALVKLLVGAKSKKVINTLFFGNEDCKKWAIQKSKELSPTKTVGIVCFTNRSNELIIQLVKAGIQVVLINKGFNSGETQKNSVTKILEQDTEQALISNESKEYLLSQIIIGEDIDELKACEIVIYDSQSLNDLEVNHFEQIRTIHSILDETSALACTLDSITMNKISNEIDSSHNLIGIKYHSPYFKDPLFELMKGSQTRGAPIKRCLKLTTELEKTAVVSNDRKEVLSEAILNAYIQEVLLMMSEGLNPHLIERCSKIAGFRLSPLMILGSFTLTELKESMNKIRKENTMTGSPESNAILSYLEGFSSMDNLLEERKNTSSQSLETIELRLFYSCIKVCLNYVEEKIIHAPIEADLVSIIQCGFPKQSGGILSYIEEQGIEKVVATMKDLAEKFGERFEAPKIIKVMDSKNISSVYDLENYFYQNRITTDEL